MTAIQCPVTLSKVASFKREFEPAEFAVIVIPALAIRFIRGPTKFDAF
jgi:hypothetical protein